MQALYNNCASLSRRKTAASTKTFGSYRHKYTRRLTHTYRYIYIYSHTYSYILKCCRYRYENLPQTAASDELQMEKAADVEVGARQAAAAATLGKEGKRRTRGRVERQRCWVSTNE